MCLLSSLKSDIVRTLLFFLGMISVGNAHRNDWLPLQHSNVAQLFDFFHSYGFMFVWDRVRPAMVWLHTFLYFKGYRR
jgi:hypothetical protein